MKIYTKSGDKGKTSLLGGKRVSKHHLRIESYGTVDELNSFIGLVNDQIPESENEIKQELTTIQELLFTIGSSLAADPDNKEFIIKPDIKTEDILHLEQAIDRMTSALPALTHFILPGGHVAISTCHVARTVCRRAERLIVYLSENEPVEPIVIQYLNRLSDYLFTLCRAIGFIYGVEEKRWIPRKK